MTKTKHPFTEAFYQLGKDVGEINRRLSVIEQGVLAQPQTTTNQPQIADINVVLEAVRDYQAYQKSQIGIQERFAKFLSQNVQDYELSEEQRRTLYNSMCQHLWEVHFTEYNGATTLPVPKEYQGKFAYIVKNSGGNTEVKFELLSETQEEYFNVEGYIPDGGGDVVFKPAYAYLVIPELVAMREPQVIGTPQSAKNTEATTSEELKPAELPEEARVTEETATTTTENEGQLIDGKWHFEREPVNPPRDQYYYVAGDLFYNGVPD